MKIILWTLASLFLISILQSAFLIGVGDWIRRDSSQTMSLSGYRRTMCTLAFGLVNTCPKNGGSVAVWKRIEDGTSVISSPFSLKSTVDLAKRDLDNYPLNVTFPCYCNPNSMDPYPALTCNFNDACFLEIETVYYVQRVGGLYTISGNATCAIGSLYLVFSLFGLILLLVLNKYTCWCGCCSSSFNKDVDMNYVKAPVDDKEI